MAHDDIIAVAIVLNDNDFGSTYIPLLQSIYKAMLWNGLNLSQDLVRMQITEGVRYHYITFQQGNKFGDPGYGPIEGTLDYLSKAKVLFNAEAIHSYCTEDYDGGAWYLSISDKSVAARIGEVYSY